MYEIYAPGEYSTIVFGRINLIQNPWTVREMFNGVSDERYVYVFHNKTHLFITDTYGDFRDLPMISIAAVGDNITDPYGGRWTVKALGDSTVSLKGLNTVASTGTYVNMTLSKSGVVRLGLLREEELGYFKSGERAGMDLNNNSLTNDTFYYLLTDADTAGVYDTFFFSNNSASLNFTNPVSVLSNRSVRTIVDYETTKLTLLSIDPRADKILFYTSDIGDWIDLGDISITNNIRIPLIAKKPNGNSITAIAKSIGAYKIDETTGVKTYISFNNVNVAIDNGVGEIMLNSSPNSANYTFTSGQYQFEVLGNTSSDTFKLEEWKWPRVNLKAYLNTERMGKGGWLNNFSTLPRYSYAQMSNTKFLELWSINLSNNGYNDEGYFNGVAENGWNINSSACTFVAPTNAHNTSTADVHESQSWNIMGYYFYFNGNTSESERVWIKKDNCNFTDVLYNTVGDYVNVTQGNDNYMLQILAIGVRNETNNMNSYVLLGINITNISLMTPVIVDPYDGGGRWKLVSMNLSGVRANALLTNASYHKMCEVYSGECASAAFITTTGNYGELTLADKVVSGSNLSSIGLDNYYIASLGPNTWEGISIIDGSNISVGMAKPIFGNLYMRDPTPILFKFVNESSVDIDLNMDGTLDQTYYIVAVDDLADGQQAVTRIIIDDDNEITPMWQSTGENTAYYDYSGNESGTIVEQWGNVPNAIWTGNLNFGPEEENRNNQSYQNIPWDQKPSWEILMFDNQDMLVSKDMWCGIDENDTLKMIVRVYNFNQSNIVGANVSINKVYRFGSMSGGIYNSSYYNVTSALTTSSGYAIVSISPVAGHPWDTNNGMNSDYIFKVLINSSGETATNERYTMIGGGCQWN
jgi:hypothetical protein